MGSGLGGRVSAPGWNEVASGVTPVTSGPGTPLIGAPGASGALEPPGSPAGATVVTIAAGMTMAEIERKAIEAALRETRGNRRKAAELLQIGERTMYRKLKEYGLGTDGIDA